jgi:catabolite regulation protein CreA
MEKAAIRLTANAKETFFVEVLSDYSIGGVQTYVVRFENGETKKLINSDISFFKFIMG